jgi:hypothetical protein
MDVSPHRGWDQVQSHLTPPKRMIAGMIPRKSTTIAGHHRMLELPSHSRQAGASQPVDPRPVGASRLETAHGCLRYRQAHARVRESGDQKATRIGQTQPRERRAWRLAESTGRSTDSGPSPRGSTRRRRAAHQIEIGRLLRVRI